MHSLNVDCDRFSIKEKVAVVVLVTSVLVEITGCEAMLAQFLYFVVVESIWRRSDGSQHKPFFIFVFLK